jgi:hypothetical protein
MSTAKGKVNLEEFEEYSKKELDYIDKYKEVSGNLMEDEEIYDLIIKYNFDDKRIHEAVLNHTELLKKKGEDYTWGVVAKGKKQKTKNEEITQNVDDSNYYRENNYRKPRNDRYQRNTDTLNYEEQKQDYYQDNQYRGRGNRGTRRGRARGNRGPNRGGRKNYENNQDYVETNYPNEPQINTNNNTQNIEESNTHTEQNNNTTHENLHKDTLHEENHINNLNTLKNVNNIHTPSTNNNLNSNVVNHEIQNVESFFQKFTLDRENEVNKLFEESKKNTKERNPKVFYEQCVNHFVKDNHINTATTFSYKPLVVKPTTNTNTIPITNTNPKNTVNPQPQVNYSQPSTIPSTTTSTNKNFPHKPAFNQQSQNPEQYYGQQQQMMYPFFYPQAGTESNMTNPQFFPQMMPPQMMYMMNQMYQQQLQSQMQMQDPEYVESIKGQKGGKNNYPYPSRENMNNFMNQQYQQGGNQTENPNYYNYDMKSQMPKNSDLSGDQSQNPNYFYYGNK